MMKLDEVAAAVVEEKAGNTGRGCEAAREAAAVPAPCVDYGVRPS